MNKKKLLQDEYKKYKEKKSNTKSYMQSMKDISIWLQKREK